MHLLLDQVLEIIWNIHVDLGAVLELVDDGDRQGDRPGSQLGCQQHWLHYAAIEFQGHGNRSGEGGNCTVCPAVIEHVLENDGAAVESAIAITLGLGRGVGNGLLDEQSTVEAALLALQCRHLLAGASAGTGTGSCAAPLRHLVGFTDNVIAAKYVREDHGTIVFVVIRLGTDGVAVPVGFCLEGPAVLEAGGTLPHPLSASDELLHAHVLPLGHRGGQVELNSGLRLEVLDELGEFESAAFGLLLLRFGGGGGGGGGRSRDQQQTATCIGPAWDEAPHYCSECGPIYIYECRADDTKQRNGTLSHLSPLTIVEVQSGMGQAAYFCFLSLLSSRLRLWPLLLSRLHWHRHLLCRLRSSTYVRSHKTLNGFLDSFR